MNKRYKEYMEQFKRITKYYNNLVELTKNHNYVGSTNEWIIDNYYLIVENKNFVKESFYENKQLKNIINENSAVYRILGNIFKEYNYNVDSHILIKALNSYQNKNNYYFSYRTITAIPVLISMIIMNRLDEVCKEKFEKQKDILKVQGLMQKIDKERMQNENINLNDYIEVDEYVINHPVYLYHLNANLKELGEISSDVYRQLHELLQKHDIDLKEIINKEHLSGISSNILISNIFNSLRNMLKLEYNVLCDKVSLTEKLLKEDPVYKGMTADTKNLYRSQIMKVSKKRDEYKYVEEIIEKSLKEKKHVGFYLFKEENLKMRSAIYVTLLAVFTVLISLLLSPFLLSNQLLSFFLLLIPVSEVVMQILNKIMMKIYPCQPLAKLDFSKGIPKEQSTMVVIPTIIKDTKKVNLMFQTLEKYYLANNTPNIYFTLLGDCMEYHQQDYEFDEDIATFGIQKAEELNKKYGKDLFYFVYRRRAFNPHENKYLGYERKRGALIHFNKMLLKKLSDEDKEKYVYAETLSNLKASIKYVITLDTDTELVLNTAQSLVGLMAHPLNKPELNKEKTRVIKGYGIVQPKVSIDIEATNESTYSQLMAGIGGFDVYSSITPNFYQDVFKEGSFVGKGIYDLAVFEQVLAETLPENLILSHDLLEGNYLRCGYASDIELIDGFPAEFLVDTSRQHRWTRGDVQITGWLKRTVRNKANKKVKSPLNLIEQFKIFDNLRRIFINPSLLLLLICSFLFPNTTPTWTVATTILIIALPLVFHIREIFRINRRTFTLIKHYAHLTFGTMALIMRVIINFITIPYNACLFLNAMCKSIYRMNFSHMNLLNWITAEDAANTINNKLSTYLKAFTANYVAAIVLLVVTIIFNRDYLVLAAIISSFFALAPLVLWRVSQHKKEEANELTSEEKEDLNAMAFRTWLYFDDLLSEETNYLIPDNYQMNREIKEDYKTSPTDIGMSLLAIVSACELEFITKDKALRLIEKVITSVEKLEKWHGHLFNWYNVKDMAKILPHDVSSVDSGNLAASFIVTKEFVKKRGSEELAQRIEKLFAQMDFSKFYTEKDVFSIGYNETEDKLSIYNYNKFASESRILSYVAIAKGDVPSRHWMCLDKSLIKFKNYKGLSSWSGTSFEYFMPALFMASYPNTLLDESYFFSEYCQKNYMQEVDKTMPWGISESAYDELDDGLNYKYKAFATPYLKVQEDKNQRIVLSPYASALIVNRSPKEVYNNLKHFKKLNMYGEFGFFEAYDYDNREPVKAFFAHHQGMSLAAITNYLKSNVIQKYFHQDIRMKAFEILLKEKVQLNPVIDLKMVRYKKYNYEREKVENDIRAFNYLSDIPEISALSNTRYLMLINDRGNGFSRFGTTQLNRYRKITEQDYGMFLYFKDLKNNKIWSNTYAPINVEPEKYNVVFASDRIKFNRTDNNIITQTEIIVTKEDNAEIRKVTLKNNTNEVKKIEVTSYTEAIISPNIDDISHRTFKNLFISSQYDQEHKSLILCRTSNSKKSKDYMVNRLLIEDEADEEVMYETERANFIGRNRNASNPLALTKKKLTNTVGTNIDPVMSLRRTIEIKPNKSKTIYFINGYGKSKEQIFKILEAYDSEMKIEEAFNFATIANNMNTKLLGVAGHDMRLYNIMLNYLYQTSRHFTSPERKDILTKNALNQSSLWKFGISGDLPIILVDIHESESLNLVKEVLKAYEYYKSRAIFVDIVIINREEEKYKSIIKREIEKEKYRMNTLYDFMSTPGGIFVVDSLEMTPEEDILLNMVARLVFKTEKCSSLEESIELLQHENQMHTYDPILVAKRVEPNIDESKLHYFNGYGGFSADGKEYVITNPDTPTPWSNVVANPNFGMIVTNNNCGFTFAYNSQMFKVTSWTNDIVLNDKSEGIKVNGEIADASAAKHGFGYSVFYNNTADYDLETQEFVAQEDTIKFYLSKITNKTNKTKKYNITYWINPTFGPNEEKSSRYILVDYFEKMNAVLLRNVYHPDFSHITTFMSSNEKIASYEIDKIIFKSITIELEVEANSMKNFSFMLGTEIGNDKVDALIKKYNTLPKIEKEFEKVKANWKNTIDTIQVKTKDESFDYMINGWYLYQTMASRLYARAGFYQVGGAYGFRDQLQDTTNICMVKPEMAKARIIDNAKHQFKEGDVLHWWHEFNRLGLRSRYKDDFLWLVYAVSEYIRITGDDKILNEQVCFVSGQMLEEKEAERGIQFNYTEDTASIYEHCALSINKSLTSLGRNGLPLMGGGDWNDGMNKVGLGGKGTSVWLGFFLYILLGRFIDITKKYDKKKDVSKYQEAKEKLKFALNTIAWDKDYYLRAFFDNGNKLGSHTNTECKIDLLSQSFAILSEVATKEQIKTIVDSVEEHLVDHNLKIVKLLTPPFKDSKDNPGYIMDYPKGIRENGGQYTHSVSWYILALLKLGNYERAYQYYQMINPINRTKTKEDVQKYKVEPYVIAADIYSNKNNPGRGGWTWYTGSSGWFYNVGLTGILGFKKEGNTLKIKPKVPKDWQDFEITYQYQDTTYKIMVNLNQEQSGIILDGESTTKGYISLKNDKKVHEVIVNCVKEGLDD